MIKKTLVLIALLCITGCQNTLLRSQSPDKEPAKADAFKSKVETRLLGDYMSVQGSAPVVLQGVGLVTGLDGTGGDPPPSVSRTELREEMKRRGVKNPETILRDPGTALVVVRAYLPTLAHKGQELDIEVRLPANSKAESLRGGWLMSTRLTEQQLTTGGVKEGKTYAVAKGPILVSGTDDDDASRAARFKRGKILAGGRCLTDRDLTVVLRSDFGNVRNAKRISDRISQRFFYYNEYGNREALADAQTDRQIELKLHPRYRDNDWRYKQVVRNIAFRESAVAARLRQQQLQQDIMQSEKAALAALQLEAIGEDSIPFLKRALNGHQLETRFHAAVALAYLDDPSGVTALAEGARDEPAFRAHAFAALSTLRDSEAQLALQGLLHETNAETRYGAFRALTILDKTNPELNTEVFPHRFYFHELDTKSAPMIHMTNRQKSEIVLFGRGQKFKTPLSLRAGQHIMLNAKDESGKIVVSRYQIGKPDIRETMPNSIAAVIRRAVELGATYPDIVEMLRQAERQSNLTSRLEIDALPKPPRSFKRVGSPKESMSDGETEGSSIASVESNVSVPVDDRGVATAVDARTESGVDKKPSFTTRVANFFKRPTRD